MAADESSIGRVLLRRIHKNHFKPGLPIVVLLEAFRPNRNDIDGVSMFLSEQDGGLSPEALATMKGNPNDYIVIAILESELQLLGLSIVMDNAPDAPRGHVLIPQINFSDYERGDPHKAAIKELTIELAKLASERIVWPLAHAAR